MGADDDGLWRGCFSPPRRAGKDSVGDFVTIEGGEGGVRDEHFLGAYAMRKSSESMASRMLSMKS